MPIQVKPLVIKQVETENEFDAYYNLRWQLLRKPWHQVKGSEQDDIEDQCYHIIAINTEQLVIGVARLQFNNHNEAQIRYMAVANSHQNRGIGRALIERLEAHAASLNYKIMTLDARDAATGFYTKLGYATIKDSYLLFDEIQHYRMEKKLSHHQAP